MMHMWTLDIDAIVKNKVYKIQVILKMRLEKNMTIDWKLLSM